ncbi:iron-containing alcohol dehydrogenase family protein [Robiginitalea aurantiaca]|uniref:Iron-containing alcohol dehydrogenase family protein n=1 Tax=Robiginitalea aurantiaca TaxID=3056915 RepID=A0ABT7WHR1_9FLAO|nr:iron-containing alcohol dehydrogenase family protein [Robiginitalea aurantiaca]MDM9632463.1 iron-containing alcohol dehydrogenase family protein [Robiginitalea aurantiaca]
MKDSLNIKAALQGSKPRNFPMVSRVVFGSGSFDQLDEILEPLRGDAEGIVVFLMDDVFEDTHLHGRIPSMEQDLLILISAKEEPKTEQVDALAAHITRNASDLPVAVVGIGGGTLLDLAKAVAIMVNNTGSSAEYQGWDLVNTPAVYHIGVPTLSGTGAEVSRTTVLMGPERKLGINSDYTPFDQVILDPDLTIGVPRDQWFFTGMDCYIHCVESLNGSYINAFSQSYGEMALALCKEVFLEDLSPEESREKLMMASWHGGMSIAYSQVGIAHALSYGLAYVMGTPHGLGNCLVFQHLEAFYPEGVRLFRQMLRKHHIELPLKITRSCSQSDFETMIEVSYGMEPLWENALGPDWKSIISRDQLLEIFQKI